jgi:ABC-2 type transport system ATP-binding protein
MDAILELRGVTKSFEGFTLDDVSFSLPRGYVMGLVGPNGAGKTTLVRLILNLARPDAGEIRVFGLDPADAEADVRSRIGFVHENPSFYDALPVERAAAVMGSFYATWDDARFRALGAEFELPLRRPVRSLSRGMRTRFALAVALSHGAELLLLDEPTSGLDPVFRRELLDRLAGVIEDGEASILFSTHITSDLDRIADYVTFLQRGRVVFSATREEVLERWALVKGGTEVLDGETRKLFHGLVTGEFGFVGLTDDPEGVQDRLAGAPLVVEKATLEDIVFYTGRTGRGGMDLHDARS